MDFVSNIRGDESRRAKEATAGDLADILVENDELLSKMMGFVSKMMNLYQK